MFLDQFSIIGVPQMGSFFYIGSTAPACRLMVLYFGAEQPSIKWQEAPSSMMIRVCSNWPAPVHSNGSRTVRGYPLRPRGT